MKTYKVTRPPSTTSLSDFCYLQVVPQAVADFLLSMGLPGVVIGAMAWWVNRQDGRVVELQKRLEEVQSKRVEDAQKMAGEALELSDALERQTELLLEIKGGKR
jgi:hypothetical protein